MRPTVLVGLLSVAIPLAKAVADALNTPAGQ